MTLEIVSHCYRYSRLLKYHLSSFLSSRPRNLQITATICFAHEDEETIILLRNFQTRSVANVTWNWIPFPVLELCRRSIGRDFVARNTQSDWVWFCDVDYWFGEKCWEAISLLSSSTGPLVFPRFVQMHRSRELGDALIAATNLKDDLAFASPDDFKPVRMPRAIGGIQIALGSICRTRGYLSHSRQWQQPALRPGFQKCSEDIWFRRDLGTPGRPVDIPEVYRIRHSKAGRDYPLLHL